MVSIKGFLRNKNVVTIIGALLLIVVLVGGYYYTVNKSLEYINVVVATKDISPRTKITASDIKVVKMPKAAVSDNVVRNTSILDDKYTNYNCLIPEGGMIYNSCVIKEEELPNIATTKLGVGEYLYSFPVNLQSTYYNTMMPGDYIDIYMKGIDEDGNLFVGRLFTHIKVLDVKDSSGRHVFDSSNSDRTPAAFFFALNEENWFLLKKASYLSSYSVELFPVPYSQATDATLDDEYVSVTSEKLREFINANTAAQDEQLQVEITETNNGEEE